MAAQQRGTTQSFIEIVDIIDSLVVLKGGNACVILEVTASNFALLSKAEQDSRIYAYASLLNSLSFPVQVVVRNKQMDVTNYLTYLEQEAKQITNPLLSEHIQMYRDFIADVINVNVVLNKAFYLIVPFSSLEAGAGGISSAVKKGSVDPAFVQTAEKLLAPKIDSILSQIQKLANTARVLGKEELIALFYDIYNEVTMPPASMETGMNSAIVKQGGTT
jgi:hypothetical protein